MRPSIDLGAIAGSLALVGALALLSPGVTAVRADAGGDPAYRAAAADGPTCEPGTLTEAEEIAAYRQWIEELRLRQIREGPEAPPKNYVVLNNRGYNYGQTQLVESGPIGLEGRR